MMNADQEAKFRADIEAKIKPILEEADDRAAAVRAKVDAGKIDFDEAMKQTGQILAETQKTVYIKMTDVIATVLVKSVAEKILSDGLLGPMSNGGIYNDTRPSCKHGHKGQCAECNTDKIDAMINHPETITITNRG
jgi:hypothetical protein